MKIYHRAGKAFGILFVSVVSIRKKWATMHSLHEKINKDFHTRQHNTLVLKIMNVFLKNGSHFSVRTSGNTLRILWYVFKWSLYNFQIEMHHQELFFFVSYSYPFKSAHTHLRIQLFYLLFIVIVAWSSENIFLRKEDSFFFWC